ncbi:MAG TPA: PASTA domain-containing protein [Solirubrobacteraceae bacterium]|nr:PASTA domain-containing protein [Solirubrobacteraceae bacterium]
MTDRTAAPERGIQRAKTNRRGGPSGRQAVGDYVGQPAGDAAQAVRRAGLRPGLDRSFGCAEELTGLVVAQEPTAGSDLARNGMVTLYVAAPGNEPVDGDTDTAGLDPDVPPPAPPAPVQAEVAQSEAPSAPARARRRKRGHARRAAPAFDPPPAPVHADRDAEAQPPTVPLAQPAVEQQRDWSPETFEQDGEQLTDDASDELGEHEFPHDEFVVHLDDVEDVLAGRGNRAVWRRAYPRRHTIGRRAGGRGIRAWLGQHRLAAGAVGAALVLWAVVGIASALDGHHTHTTTASAGSQRPAGTHRTAAAKPAPALSSKALHTTPRSLPAQSTQPRPRPSAPRRRWRPAPALVREALAPPIAAPKETAMPAVPSTPAARASAPPAPAQEQTQGGLFSP